MNEKMQKSILFAGDRIGFRALIFFDLVKYHMEVTITVPSKNNNLHHLNSVVSTLRVVSKVNFSHLHKCI